MEFKAVKWVRSVRDANYEQTKNMSVQDRKEFYKNKADSLQSRLKRLKTNAAADK